jgi:hypothetical protein
MSEESISFFREDAKNIYVAAALALGSMASISMQAPE